MPRLSTVRPDVDPVLDDIVARALAKDVNDRFSTAAEMQAALDRFVRASGFEIDDAEIGRAMSAHFTETRERMQGQIKTYLSTTTTTQPGVLPDLTSTSTTQT